MTDRKVQITACLKIVVVFREACVPNAQEMRQQLQLTSFYEVFLRLASGKPGWS